MVECNGYIHPMGVPSFVYVSNPRYCNGNMYLINASLDYGYAFAPLVNLDLQMSIHNHDRMTKMLEALAQIDRKIEEMDKSQIWGSPSIMHPSTPAHVSSQREEMMSDKSIANLNVRLMSPQA